MKPLRTAADILFDIIELLLIISLPLSFFNAFKQSPCETYGYYLPVTFIMCNINKERQNE